jgi:chromosome segregation ATPase
MEREEEADVWKDLLEQETARREQADDENKRLREEVFKLKQDMSSLTSGGGLHHTTNIYNITKKHRDGNVSPGRPVSGVSGDMESSNGNFSAATTLVDELRRESEQLRHENAELRREVGAQTSMLTSRNREKERLYQEIEDLKMAQRRGRPAPSTIDSLLERSASQVGGMERPQSRGSMKTRTQIEEEADREELENKMNEMRDKLSEVKLQNQELQRELEICMEDFEAAIGDKRQAEEAAMTLQEDLNNAMNDLVALQSERDEALREQNEMESEFEALRKEAQEEIDALESEADQQAEEMQRVQADLQDRSENFDALQEEMRKMSEALIRLEDDQENKLRRIQQLEQELDSSNKELEELEQKLMEANDKNQRLSVQQESSQGEIAFLREEQETDKIRIGDLEAAMANAEQSIREEKERVKELENRLQQERHQREIVADQEKEEVQQFVNELNREASAAKDEARRLRKNLTSREVEATEWKERLMELENNLREALGDLNGTRSSLLKVSCLVLCLWGIYANGLSQSPSYSGSLRIPSAIWMLVRRRLWRRIVSSRCAIHYLSLMRLRVANLQSYSIRSALPTATQNRSTTRSKSLISTLPVLQAVRMFASLSSRRTRVKIAGGSHSLSNRCAISYKSAMSYCCSSGTSSVNCVEGNGSTATPSSTAKSSRQSKSSPTASPASPRISWPPSKPSRT